MPNLASSAIQRRLGRPLAPIAAVPSPTLSPDQPPEFREPTAVMPAANVQATPAVDVKQLLSTLDAGAAAPPEAHPVRDAIGRALYAFGRGMRATPASGAYSPVLGGLAGGLTGTGEVLEEQRQQDVAARNAALEPRRAFIKSLTDQAAKSAVEDPYKQAQTSREQAGREAEIRLRHQLEDERISRLAKAKAEQLGVSEQEYHNARNEAEQDVLLNRPALQFGTPEYQDAVDQAAMGRLAVRKRAGMRLPNVNQPKPAARPRASGALPGIE